MTADGWAAAANAIIDDGSGNASIAISGTMITPPTTTMWTRMETGTVYHFCDPTLMDGSTTSPNMSFGTGLSSYPTQTLHDGSVVRRRL